MLQGIKNIIFDLGGVIYAINYKTTIKAFQSLGINDFDSLFAKAGQSSLFDDLETGRISKDEFFINMLFGLLMYIFPFCLIKGKFAF